MMLRTNCSVEGTFEGKHSKTRARTADDAADRSIKEQPKVHQKGSRHQFLVTEIVILVLI